MAKDTFLNGKTTLNVKGRLLDISTPAIMAILNLTPDSFYGSSRSSTVDDAIRRSEGFLNEGAQIIDIGAYSSRPGAVEVNTDEELKRIIPVIEAITKKLPEAIISIDTFRAKVARESILTGAHIINDIAAGSMDDAMFDTVAELQTPYIMMHMKGTPQTMQQNTCYAHIGVEVLDYFAKKIAMLKKMGVKDIIIDPGFGFSKTLEQNYQLLKQMDNLHIPDLPILVGVSRKSMIYKFLGCTPEEALNGTTVLNTFALLKGAKILRVHDVKEAVETIKILTLVSANS